MAIELPAAIKMHLANIQKELHAAGADAKWVTPQNIHLTLKFLGNTPVEKIKELNALLTKHFSQRKCFTVTLNELGVFPSLGSVRVVWAGLDDITKQLKKIALQLDEALGKMGFEKETREFQAHATLARIRSSRNKIALIEKIKQANQHFKPQEFCIDNITLFESQLSPKGPTYGVIHQVKFL